MKRLKPMLAILTVCGLGLAGCANTKPAQIPLTENEQLKVEFKETLEALDQRSAEAVNAQRELALSADAKVRRESNNRKRFLTDSVSYDFYGDVEKILRDVANTYDYTFKVVGQKPASGVIVNVYSKNQKGTDLLNLIAHADTGKRVDIRLTDASIILYYNAASNTSLTRLERDAQLNGQSKGDE